MNDLWYVRRGNQVKGPFKTSIIEQLVTGNRIRDADELSRDRVTWQTFAALRPTFAGETEGSELIEALNRPSGSDHVTLDEASVARAQRPEVPEDVPEHTVRTAPIPTEPRSTHASASEGLETDNSGSNPESYEAQAEWDDSVRQPARRLAADSTTPIVPRRFASFGRSTETPLVRTKQAASLISIMALIVVAGIAFLPAEKLDSPDCAAPAKPGVNWSNCRFDGRNLKGAELDESALRSVHLRDANLLGMRLGASDLAYAELTNANLSYSDLSAVSAVGADLRGADLAYANLEGADLSHADLTGANLGGAALRGARLDHAIWVDRRRCLEGSSGGCKLPLRRNPGESAVKR